MRALRLVLFLLLCGLHGLDALALAANGAAATGVACTVLDPELRDHYAGPCVDGLAQGEGVARGADAEYRGSFVAGRKHGRGVVTFAASGDRYEGEFEHGRKHGRGIYVWGPRSPWSGERFDGDYRDDRRHGQGTYTWSTGDRYSGPWENDLQAGLQTPMQRQRTRATKAGLTVIGKPGTRVCGTSALGLDRKQRVEGEVREVLQDRLLVRVVAIDGEPAARDDVFFWAPVIDLRPCRPAAGRRAP